MVISTVIFTYYINIYVAQIYFYNLQKGCTCHLLLQVSNFQSTKESQLTCKAIVLDAGKDNYKTHIL